MTYSELFEQIQKKQSFLCIGLDSDIDKIPKHLMQKDDPIFEFNKQIIDATHHLCVAYKPNIAFYESQGISGWQSLEKTVLYCRENYSDLFLIADAKRGDIGNTSKMYARAFLETLPFDSITVAPYMGEDSVSPFLEYKDKFVILLALTSNKGAFDFQYFKSQDEGMNLYEKVLLKSQQWGDHTNMMYVVGATKAEYLSDVRKHVPYHFLLVPGVGAQGGSLKEVAEYGMNSHCGLLVNSSRGIIYAGSNEDFADKARLAAEDLQHSMSQLLSNYFD
jgi:orotidine-5'-phosphate decarboxylase